MLIKVELWVKVPFVSYKKYQELEEQLAKMNLDENKYMEWGYLEITQWIINLDEGYDKFKDILRKKLKREDVKGDMLIHLDKGDLDRFGVVLMKDKIAILSAIKKLTAKQTSLTNDEGN